MSRKGRVCSYICFHYELLNSGRGTRSTRSLWRFYLNMKDFHDQPNKGSFFTKCTRNGGRLISFYDTSLLIKYRT